MGPGKRGSCFTGLAGCGPSGGPPLLGPDHPVLERDRSARIFRALCGSHCSTSIGIGRGEGPFARLDPLTGIFNRRAFEELAAGELSRAARYGRPLSLAFVDLDHFKQVNDDFGHEVGDTVLCQVAATLISTMRSADVVARIGGDEFAVLMPETDSQAAMTALEKSRAALKALMQMNAWPTTFSMGVVSADGPQLTLPELLAAADRLMYEAKRTGRDRIVQITDPTLE